MDNALSDGHSFLPNRTFIKDINQFQAIGPQRQSSNNVALSFEAFEPFEEEKKVNRCVVLWQSTSM